MTLCLSVVMSFYNKTGYHLRAFMLDIVTIVMLIISILFIVQPVFHDIKYFTNNSTVYTSLCNINRFLHNITSFANHTDTEVTAIYKSESWKGYLYAVLGGLCGTISVTSGQKLLMHNTLQDIILWLSSICSGISLIITLIMGGFLIPQTTFCVIQLILNSISGALFDCFFFIAMSYIPSIDLALTSAFVLPLVFVFQFTFLRSISPTSTNAVAVISAIVVLIIVVGKPALQGYLTRKGWMQ